MENKRETKKVTKIEICFSKKYEN
ncbi:Hypothetical Protein MfeM64YM_0076 [Mycoplasmopsis fermentans M64]|uniref:Uncharacterized protein n=1 Tax=Mycoplasmopsis fermentans (strain M64) TaxID=943945 RepID=A0AB32XAQ6_MYCFM|nr:Hypothetical Protein MfeM64YM_0076 [Mycoplasmopsis fermentans M64]